MSEVCIIFDLKILFSNFEGYVSSCPPPISYAYVTQSVDRRCIAISNTLPAAAAVVVVIVAV